MIVDRLKRFLLRGNIGIVTALPIAIGFSVLLLWGLFNNLLRPYTSLDWAMGFALALCFWICGLSGVIQIIRKETYGLFNTHGTWAVISGILTVTLFWGLSLLGIYFWIIETF